jgi:hypothetical protein
LERDLPLAQDAAQRLDRNTANHPTTLQVARQSPQRPVRQRFAQAGRRSECDRHAAVAGGRLKRPRPASADFWVQALEAEGIEGRDHAAHVGLIGLTDERNLGHGRVDQRGRQDLGSLAHRLPARLPRVRQELHLALLQCADKQRRTSHAPTSVALIVADSIPLPEALIAANLCRTHH